MHRKSLIFASVIAFVFLINRVPLSAQDVEDKTPPVLTVATGLDFTPKQINTVSGSATVNVTLSGTDDLSGLNYFIVYFHSPSGYQNQNSAVWCTPGVLTCTNSVVLTFPQFGEAGTWTVSSVIVYDMVGNQKLYRTADLTDMGLPTQLEVAGNQDSTPPDLTVATGLDFTPKQINTASGSATVNVTLSATDDLSGLNYFIVYFHSPSGYQNQNSAVWCTPGVLTCTNSVVLTFPQFGETGVWTVSSVIVYDMVGNQKLYRTADLTANGLPTQLEVTGNQDSNPPLLSALDFTPKQINTASGSATVNVTLSATDDLSGLNYFIVYFHSPTGYQNQNSAVWCTPGVLTCTNSVVLTFPQFSETGIWAISSVIVYDMVGNQKFYRTADLADMGLPTQLLNTPLSASELVVTNARLVTEGSKGKWTTASLQALVQNIGILPASNLRVSFAYSIDDGVTFTEIGVNRIGTLAPGVAGTAGYAWKTQPGTYKIRVTVDPDNRIKEFDETNNSGVFSLTVK
jgi:hypothetical protein